jgi:glucose/arabinose dehydrogenase
MNDSDIERRLRDVFQQSVEREFPSPDLRGSVASRIRSSGGIRHRVNGISVFRRLRTPRLPVALAFAVLVLLVAMHIMFTGSLGQRVVVGGGANNRTSPVGSAAIPPDPGTVHRSIARTTVVGTGHATSGVNRGSATAAQLGAPRGVAVASDGGVYIADEFNNQVYRVSPAGVITTVAGSLGPAFSGDGGRATAAKLFSPLGVAVARDGSIYIADPGDERVRRVSSTGIITTVAGDGQSGSSGDGGPATAAEVDFPSAVAVAADGNLYVATEVDNRVRRVSPAGIITTVAGDGQYGSSGDGGPATAAELADPVSVAVAADGNVYIADAGNDRVRRVSPAGIITTVAGDGVRGSGGDGGPATAAELDSPSAVAMAADGDLYIATEVDNRVRRVSPAGIITTVAGDGQYGSSGDGGPATAAELANPVSVAVAADGSLYIADAGNDRVRRVSPAGVITTVAS